MDILRERSTRKRNSWSAGVPVIELPGRRAIATRMRSEVSALLRNLELQTASTAERPASERASGAARLRVSAEQLPAGAATAALEITLSQSALLLSLPPLPPPALSFSRTPSSPSPVLIFHIPMSSPPLGRSRHLTAAPACRARTPLRALTLLFLAGRSAPLLSPRRPPI